MTIKDILISLDKNTDCGVEVTKRKGILNTTWIIYRKESDYYFFDINENFVFDQNHKYSKKELEEEYKDSFFEIDCYV